MSDAGNITTETLPMDIMVEEVRIRNFRSHKDTQVKLTPLTLLVGANNAGKTSFLRAIGVALGGDKRFLSKEDLHIGGDGNQDPNAKIEIELKLIPSEGNLFSEKWEQIFGEEINSVEGKDFVAYRTEVSFDPMTTEPELGRLRLRTWETGREDSNTRLKADLRSLTFHFIDAKRDLLDDLGTSGSYWGRMVKQIVYSQTDLTEIEAALTSVNERAVSNSDVLLRLKTRLQELNKTIGGNGSGVEITPLPKRIRDLHKGLKVHFQDGNSDSFSLEYHGMGTRSWASLLAFKAYAEWVHEKSVIDQEAYFPFLALEEPEAHLHPNAQRQLYTQIKGIPGQKIVSTHSPYVAALAKLEELRHFGKDGDASQVSQIDITDREDIRRVEREIFNTRGELIFSRAVVLFEGETEEQAFPHFARRYFGCEPFELGINFVGCNGNAYASFIRLFHACKVPWFIFSDYDKESIKTGVNNALRLAGITDPLSASNAILVGDDLEQYLINEGYGPELRASIIECQSPKIYNEIERLGKEKTIATITAKVQAYSSEELLKRLDAGKAQLAPIYSRIISNLHDDSRAIPPKIRELFDAIKAKL